MGPVQRLMLLFAGDEDLLQLNTGLHSVPNTLPTPPIAVQVPEIQLESSRNPPGDQPPAQAGGEAGSEQIEHPSAIHNSADRTPHDGTFCPLMAISRFPYHQIQGDLMQRVASKFFDKGQFWDRSWDLYYIHIPPRVGSNHLLLVPAIQVRELLGEINKVLDCALTLPMNEEKGIMLQFHRDGFPQPIYLGQTSSREMKDCLDSEVPYSSHRDQSHVGMDEQAIAFEKMMKAACAASKGKKKAGKAKKQQLRAQRQVKLAEGLKQAQAYLGLRSLESFSDVPEIIDDRWDQEQSPSAQLPRLTADQPAPFPFWKEPVFISIDAEANELCHTQVTEVGISTLDTRDLAGLAPGLQGVQWRSCIHSRHLRVKEYRHIVNRRFVAGCPDRFQFGTSEWVSEEEIGSVVQGCFSQPSFFDTPGHNLRPLVLVGHGLRNDIEYLKVLGLEAVTEKNGTLGVVDYIDTADCFQLIREEIATRSLGAVLAELEITGWHLHNAGNDARYTMEALVGMLVVNGLK